jgi:Flp pilus assembly protein TadG
MRRVTRRRRDERGAMVVFLAAFSVVMVGMAALVVDVGSVLDEKRQLQNGADAGALAVAHSCAQGACNYALAGPLANSNSKDRESAVKEVKATGNDITVTTRTSASGSSILPYEFGRLLTGVKGKEVTASATARWAPLGRAVVLRLAISACDVERLGTSPVPQTIMFHSTGTVCDKTSGQDASGAFGWLDDDNPPSGLKCELTATAGQTASGDPGASGPTECLNPYFPIDILLPVFDDKVGVVKK